MSVLTNMTDVNLHPMQNECVMSILTTLARFDGNSNNGFYNDETCHSNVFMISHTFPMQGCLPSNALNDTKTGSTMCTKLAQVSQNSFLLTLAQTSELTKVVQSLSATSCSMASLSLNNLSTIKKLVANHVFVGFNNIRLVS